VHGVGESQLQLAVAVERGHELVAVELAGEERRLVRDARVVGRAEDAIGSGRGGRGERGPQRGIERVIEVVAEAVVAERRRGVHAPATHVALPAAGRGVVGDDGTELGQEPERVDLRPVAVVVGVAAIAVAGAETVCAELNKEAT